jgi:hypothetical protein
MSVNGYMLFKAEFEGNEPHPDNAPDGEVAAFTAQGFAEAYSLYPSLETATEAAREDNDVVLDAVARGDMQDADDEAYVLPVTVAPDGTVTVFDARGVQEIRRYTVEEMYEGFFGMEPPQLAEPDPEP